MKTRFPVRASLALVVVILLAVGLRLDWLMPHRERMLEPFSFAEGFEDITKFEDLFRRDSVRWHGTQLQSGTNPQQNIVELTSAVAHSGTRAMKFHAAPYDGRKASKADILRQELPFVDGDDVWFSGWYYLVGGTDAGDVFLCDLETTKKYQGPGRRIYLQTGEYLACDLGKWWTGKTFRQPKGKEVPFPKDRWVRLSFHMYLSPGNDGRVEVWQDDTKVLDGHGKTLPTSKTIYNQLQVGLTSNGNRKHAQTLYVDDVILSNRPIR